MRGRPRGESDLGRPPQRTNAKSNGYWFPTIQEGPVVASASWLTMPELLTAVLLPLPYLFASLAYPSSNISPLNTPSAVINSHDQLLQVVSKDTESIHGQLTSNYSPLVLACALSSANLLLIGTLSRIRSSDQPLDRRKGSFGNSEDGKIWGLWNIHSLQRIGGRIMSVLLPFYASMQLGGARTAIVLLTVTTTGIGSFDVRPMKHTAWENTKRTIRTRKATCVVLFLGIVCDFLDFSASASALVLGHLALAASVLGFPPPLPTTGWPLLTNIRGTTGLSAPAAAETPWNATTSTKISLRKPISPLISSPEDTKLTLVAGMMLCIFTIVAAVVLSTSPPISFEAITFTTLSIASATALVFFSLPSSLRTQRKFGVAIGCILIAGIDSLRNSGIWKEFPYISILCVLSYAAVSFDTTTSISKRDVCHHDHKHETDHHPLHGNHSRFSGYLIKQCPPGSILHSVLIEKDSRRIAYFAVLNLAFMLVQFFYGFVSGSLGLLTDSIHMLFDCVGLAVGLAAAVMSKWPSNVRFPYGFGKVDTLSGFANGIFLMLVSVEIIFDAFERLWEGHELRRLNELLVVSVLGLLVNIVGLTAFGHAHHGHDHGGHSHDHNHSDGGHHDNENMQGIFLHIMADALGSVAVIISTLLAKFYGWSGWDPIASCIIAVLIFLSAIPLVKSSGLRLLLSLPADVEYGIRNTLQEISSLRGVVGYSVPRFWLEDAGAAHAEVHAHEHEHKHVHEHEHSDHCDHSHSHSPPCNHGHGHGHDHGHSHSHNHSHSPPYGHGHGHAYNHSHSHDAHNHSHSYSHAEAHEPHTSAPAQKILGVIHVIAARTADLEDVRERTVQFLKGRGMDVVVHVEREGEGRCWCGGGSRIG